MFQFNVSIGALELLSYYKYRLKAFTTNYGRSGKFVKNIEEHDDKLAGIKVGLSMFVKKKFFRVVLEYICICGDSF